MIHVSVVALQNPDFPNLFLHGLRRDNDKYCLSGGHAKPGETPAETAQRELREETGFNLHDLRQVRAERHPSFADPEGVMVTLFTAPYPGGDPTNANDPDQEFKSFAFLDPLTHKGPRHVPAGRDVLCHWLEGRGDLTKSQFEDLNKAPLTLSPDMEVRNQDPQLDTHLMARTKSEELPNGLYHHVFQNYKRNQGKEYIHTVSQFANPDKTPLAYLEGRKTPTGLSIDWSQVLPGNQGKGYGRQVYAAALLHHGKLESDNVVSPRANRVWEDLIHQRGIKGAEAPYGTPDRHFAQVVSPSRIDRKILFPPISPSFIMADKKLKKNDDYTELTHYSPTQNIKEIDPVKHGERGIGAEYRRGLPEHRMSFYYRAGSTPEDIVRSGAKSKYTIRLSPEKKIYNMSKDPEGIVNRAIEDNNGIRNPDLIHGAIKDSGYFGFYNPDSHLPNAVGLYYAHPVHEERPLDMADFAVSKSENLHKTDKLNPQEEGGFLPDPKIRQIASNYMKQSGLPVSHPMTYSPLDRQNGMKVAHAYSQMKHDPNDPEVKRSYNALARETLAQYQAMKNSGIKLDRIKPGQLNPYPNGATDLHADVARGHMWYSPTFQDTAPNAALNQSSFSSQQAHPMLQMTNEIHNGHRMPLNDVFRVVHDYFGHAKEGVNFSPRGEEHAWRSHLRMYTPLAAKALTSETRGQSSMNTFGPHGKMGRHAPDKMVFTNQKAGLLPDWANRDTTSEGVIRKAAPGEGPHKHHTVPVAENIDWHLRHLWETPQSPGGYRTIKEISPEEHPEHHRKNPVGSMEHPRSKAYAYLKSLRDKARIGKS